LSLLNEMPPNVVIGNNDLVFDRGFLEQLDQLEVEPDVFAICPDIVTPVGDHQNPHVIQPMSVGRKAAMAAYFSNYYVGAAMLYIKRRFMKKRARFVPGRFEIHMGIGACYILKKKFLECVGRLDERVFLYGEEAFLTNQIKSNGGRLMYCSELRVLHLESIATAKIPRKEKYRMTQESFRQYRSYL